MKQILDSSDEESEGEIIKKSDLVKELELKLIQVQNSADFAFNLALITHYISDRVFRNSEIDVSYKKHKLNATGLSKEDFLKIINNVSTTVKNILGIEDVSDQDSVKCFNFIFNSNVKLSKELNKKISIKKVSVQDFDFSQALLNELKTLQLDLVQLSTNPLVLEVSKENASSAELLSFSKTVSRNNKNTIKDYKLKDIDSNVTNVSYKLPNIILGTFSEHYIVKNNDNTLAHLANMGTYANIFKDQFFKDNKTEIIKNIFNIIKNEKPITIKDNSNHIDEKLTHLIFITEMIRNNATLFIAPMFLELIQKDQKTDFPMTCGGATSDSRGVGKHYANYLPKHHSMDYDYYSENVSNQTNTQKFLKAEGQLIITWLKSIDKNLKYFFEKLEMHPSLIAIKSKVLDQISVNEITQVSDFLKTTAYALNWTENDIGERIFHIVNHVLADQRITISLDKNQVFITKQLKGALEKNNNNEQIKKILIELKDLIDKLYNEYNTEKDKTTDYINNTNIENEIATILPNLLNSLSDGLEKWYNIKINFDKFFQLKAAGDKQDKYDPDTGDHKMFIEVLEIKANPLPNTKLEIDYNNLKKNSSDQFLDSVEPSLNKKLVYPQEEILNFTGDLEQDFNLDKKYDKMLGNKRKSPDIEEGIYNAILEHKSKISDPNELYNIFFARQEQYKDIVTQIKNIPGYYDDNAMFTRIIKRYTEEYGHGLKGSGEFGEEKNIDYIDPYFGKYTLDALENILALRIGDLHIKNIKIFQSIFIDQNYNNISNVLTQILSSTEKTILVPLNLFNKHAVGLIFEKGKDTFKIKYCDSLNNSISQEIKQLIADNFTSKINFQQITVEQQKYANCGAEVIENFIFYLTGKRVSQEKAIELHSKLVENALLNIEYFGVHLLFGESDNSYYSLTDYLEQINQNYGIYHNFDYDNHQHIEVAGEVASFY